LITYFKDSRTLARYRSGLANLYLEDFIVWLESQGYRRLRIRRHVCGVVQFADWTEAEGLALHDLDRGALNRLVSQLAERNSLRYPCGKQKQICRSASLFIDFLEEIGAVEPRPACTSTQDPALLLQFREWMRSQRGTLDSTLNEYRRLDGNGHTYEIVGILRDEGTFGRRICDLF
jgi:hypothetical protein